MALRTTWLITSVHLDYFDDEVGTMGPMHCNLTAAEVRAHPDRARFRMYDDDGIHYYSGLIVEDPDASGFEPLEDFGMPNAGCTRIDYLEGGKWQTL